MPADPPQPDLPMSKRPAEAQRAASVSVHCSAPEAWNEAYPLPRSCLNGRVGCVYPVDGQLTINGGSYGYWLPLKAG